MKNNYSKYRDVDLIKMISSKKPEGESAFSELYDRYAVKLRSFCNYMVQSSANVEDIFQETFIFFYTNVRAGKEVSNAIGYLISIARNLCLKYYRDKKTNVPFDVDSLVIDESRELEKNELLDLVVKTLPLLESKYREAIIMREFEGLSYPEISEICQTSVSNAKSRVFRAHKQIIKILEPYLKDLAK